MRDCAHSGVEPRRAVVAKAQKVRVEPLRDGAQVVVSRIALLRMVSWATRCLGLIGGPRLGGARGMWSPTLGRAATSLRLVLIPLSAPTAASVAAAAASGTAPAEPRLSLLALANEPLHLFPLVRDSRV